MSASLKGLPGPPRAGDSEPHGVGLGADGYGDSESVIAAPQGLRAAGCDDGESPAAMDVSKGDPKTMSQILESATADNLLAASAVVSSDMLSDVPADSTGVSNPVSHAPDRHLFIVTPSLTKAPPDMFGAKWSPGIADGARRSDRADAWGVHQAGEGLAGDVQSRQVEAMGSNSTHRQAIGQSEEGQPEEEHAVEGHAEEEHAVEGHAVEGHAEEGHVKDGRNTEAMKSTGNEKGCSDMMDVVSRGTGKGRERKSEPAELSQIALGMAGEVHETDVMLRSLEAVTLELEVVTLILTLPQHEP